MEDFLHRENVIIFKRQLADAKTDAHRQLLLKLFAEEEARRVPLSAAASRRAKDRLPLP